MELFKLLGTIAVENTDAVKAIKETSGEGEKAESKLSNAFGKIGSAAAKVGKVVAAGVGTAATAIGTITAMAVKNYADYEQLVGGVETLFNKTNLSLQEYAESVGKTCQEAFDEWGALTAGARIIQNNAEEAFRTAGLSANEYMETVTSFSASLIASLDGDTKKAAEAADRAIIDMADNANKMGSSMESIQNAYQGFAKQNYTMLDNLKLGYGGTKEEMARLIEDAAKMTDVQEELGVSVDESSMSFANIVNAISVVQKSMGIMGATAAEASSTISGSIASMKAAWKNLLVGFADSSQDIDTLVSNMVDSVVTVGKNLIPRIQETLQVAWGVVKENAPKILAEIPTMVMELLPQSVKDIMTEAHDYLCDTVVFGLEAVWESIKNLASAFKPLVDAVKSFIAPLKDANEQQRINVEIVYFLEEALYKIADVINIVANVLKTVFTFIAEHKKLVESMVIVIGSFAASFVLVTNTVKTFTGILTKAKAAISVVSAAFTFLASPIGIAVVAIGALIAAGVLLYKNWDEIKAKASEIFSNMQTTISTKLDNIKTKFTTTFENAKNTVQNAIEKIKGFFKFEWSLPKIKLPHFGISGSFSLNPPSVPKLSVDWYKKAMDDPMIMNSPTAFGINANGQIMAGGEAGSEVVSGTETLMNMISSAVAAQNEELTNTVSKLFAFLQEYLPGMANMQLVMDSGAVIGELAPGMDKALGRIAYRKERWV